MIELQVEEGNKFTCKNLNINQATSTVLGQLLKSAIFKKIHPIGCFYRLMTKKSVALTSYTKTMENNAKIVRKFVHDYVCRRKT